MVVNSEGGRSFKLFGVLSNTWGEEDLNYWVRDDELATAFWVASVARVIHNLIVDDFCHSGVMHETRGLGPNFGKCIHVAYQSFSINRVWLKLLIIWSEKKARLSNLRRDWFFRSSTSLWRRLNSRLSSPKERLRWTEGWVLPVVDSRPRNLGTFVYR